MLILRCLFIIRVNKYSYDLHILNLYTAHVVSKVDQDIPEEIILIRMAFMYNWNIEFLLLGGNNSEHEKRSEFFPRDKHNKVPRNKISKRPTRELSTFTVFTTFKKS